MPLHAGDAGKDTVNPAHAGHPPAGLFRLERAGSSMPGKGPGRDGAGCTLRVLARADNDFYAPSFSPVAGCWTRLVCASVSAQRAQAGESGFLCGRHAYGDHAPGAARYECRRCQRPSGSGAHRQGLRRVRGRRRAKHCHLRCAGDSHPGTWCDRAGDGFSTPPTRRSSPARL